MSNGLSGKSGTPPSSGGGDLIDLTTAGISGVVFDVSAFSNLSVYMSSASWGTSIVEIEWSTDGMNWHSFSKPKTAMLDTAFAPFSVEGIPFLAFDVTLNDGAAGEVLLHAFGDKF